jgi:hypothetical protein
VRVRVCMILWVVQLHVLDNKLSKIVCEQPNRIEIANAVSREVMECARLTELDNDATRALAALLVRSRVRVCARWCRFDSRILSATSWRTR